MSLNKLLRKAEMFYLLASESEELPEDSKDLKVVLNNLDSLETYQARKKYAEKNLKHLSSGSSRIVYLSPNKTVIKLAKNERGLAQNKTETSHKTKSKFLNKVLKNSKNFSWIEVPFIKKITPKEFKKMVDIDFDDFDNSIRYGLRNISESSNKEKPKNFEEVSKTEIYKDIKNIAQQANLMPGDIARISSWGVIDNHPVLIDSGLSKDVFEDYYESST